VVRDADELGRPLVPGALDFDGAQVLELVIGPNGWVGAPEEVAEFVLGGS